MTRPYSVAFSARAARQTQRERTWLHNHLGAVAADAFEAELRHALELIAACPAMGDASPEAENDRHWFLRRSCFHVFYRVLPKKEAVLVFRIRHQAQRPLKR